MDVSLDGKPEASPTQGQLLAVDLGLRAGLALYGRGGRLVWYRSTNFGKLDRLRRGVYGVMQRAGTLDCVVIEGGGNLAAVWRREARRRGVSVLQIDAATWRRKLLLPRNQGRAKYHADHLARQVIEWSNIKRPTSLRHDAAEAILIGLWGVLELGWLAENPVREER